MWNWDEVFRHLVQNCDNNGGYYELSIENGSRFKDGPIKRGWGEANLRKSIFPHYKKIYPDYDFGLSSNRVYLWCKLKTAKFLTYSLALNQKSKESKLTHERTTKISNQRHNESCKKCKISVEKMLIEIYGKVERNYQIEVSTKLENYKNFSFYINLYEILKKLQNNRGHTDFIKTPTLHPCDFFIPNPGFILEFDESQHFTFQRKLSLQNYPQNLKLKFSLQKWVCLCEKCNRKDNDKPYRDEQRAWYDTLRDFLSEIEGLEPTARLYSNELKWCDLNTENPKDIEKFMQLIGNRKFN